MNLTSRFIKEDDDKFLQWGPFSFDSPLWWSRRYEYCWALQFADEDDLSLDAGCGVGHPFKFMLQEVCPQTSAGDKNARLLLRDCILQEVWDGHGKEAKDWVAERIDDIDIGVIDLTSIDRVPRETFTRIFCISTLEHLEEEEQKEAIAEFSRILHPDGLLVMTFDFPTVSMKHLKECMEEAKLEFAGEVDEELAADSITDGSIAVFRAVVRKQR